MTMDGHAELEGLQRKERSEAILRSEGVPINRFLPGIGTDEARFRNKDEVAHRAMALLVVAVKGEGLEQPLVDELISDYKLESHFTPKETHFIKTEFPSEHDRIQFSWRYEAAWTLLWALSFVDKLDRPARVCDASRAVRFLSDRALEQFFGEAKLRSPSEILDEADLILRYDWAVVDARVNGKPIPTGLDRGVVQERHHALNWLFGYQHEEWDDVHTDT